MYAGRSSYIPLRLNNAGVISIIFAISILLLPQQALSWFGTSQSGPGAAVSSFLNTWFSPNSFLYNAVYFVLVVMFTFFYSAIVVNTRGAAVLDNMRAGWRIVLNNAAAWRLS